jgi:uncharacterized protein with LGFP repeats
LDIKVTGSTKAFNVVYELNGVVEVVYLYRLNKGSPAGGGTTGGTGGTTGGSTGGSGGANDIGGPIGFVYRQLNGASGPLGNVRSAEINATTSPKGTTGRVRHFNGGQIDLHTNGRFNGQAFAVYGEIGRKYNALGGTMFRLGFPVSNEGDVPTATKGRWQAFEDGLMIYHSSGRYRGQTFEIDGTIFNAYNKNGGMNSFLGLPVSDPTPISVGLRQLFEYGYMDWFRADKVTKSYRYR